MQEEQIVVIPDLFLPKEKLQFCEKGFSHFFHNSGYRWHPHALNHLIRLVGREDAEKVPNPLGERIRQLVANVLVFTLPDDIYLHAQTYGKNEQKNFVILDLIKEHAVLMASQKLKGSGEKRLHGKIAAGFGGHVDGVDVLDGDMTHALGSSRPAFDYMIQHAAIRELTEELQEDDSFAAYAEDHLVPMGVINSSFSEVESVHFGCIHVLVVPNCCKPKVREVDKLQEVPLPLKALREVGKAGTQQLDQWTKLIFDQSLLAIAHFIAKSAAGQKPFR